MSNTTLPCNCTCNCSTPTQTTLSPRDLCIIYSVLSGLCFLAVLAIFIATRESTYKKPSSNLPPYEESRYTDPEIIGFLANSLEERKRILADMEAKMAENEKELEGAVRKQNGLLRRCGMPFRYLGDGSLVEFEAGMGSELEESMGEEGEGKDRGVSAEMLGGGE
jgi:hypothetical protein